MKAIGRITTAALALSFFGLVATAHGGTCSCSSRSCTKTHSSSFVRPHVEYTAFYKPLATHGSWIFSSHHGWVWRPYVARGHRHWHPRIHGGSWQRTCNGARWQPTYTWGAIVYSQGRWALTASVGWVWIPPRATLREHHPVRRETVRYQHVPHHPAPKPTQHYRQPRRTQQHPAPRQPAVQIPTRRSQRVNSVAKSKSTKSEPAKKSSHSSSSSRARRTISVTRR